MRTLIVLLLTCSSIWHVKAQTNTLKEYLDTHKYTIHKNENNILRADNKLYSRLDELAETKRLIVYGEGFSHNLHTNGYLEEMFIEYLSKHGLKYVFGEQARSWIVTDNFYYDDPKVDARSFFPDYKPATQKMLDVFKQTYQSGNFGFRAMDFERVSGFKIAVDSIAGRLTTEKKNELIKLAPYLTDTSYTFLSAGKFIKFYETQRNSFFRDSITYRTVLGDLYAGFHYLLSDPQPSQYTDNRNRNMANHVLWQMGEPGHDARYFISCGSAHAQRGKRDGGQKTTVAHLEDSEQLKGKILVVNIYCEDCHPEPNKYGVGDNSRLGFMKGAVLTSFQQATGTESIVAFDLSELPEEYKYINEEYSDWLVFAKGQE